MDIVEAINTRKSIRAFKPDPVPQTILQEILGLTQRAPSWGNTQPWEFAVVTGKKLEEIRKGFLDRIESKPNPDIPRPEKFVEPYNTRGQIAIAQSHKAGEIRRGDKEGKLSWERQQLTNFGSPCEIYIYIERELYFQDKAVNSYSIFDCGAVAQNIMLLATKYELGTIAQAQAVAHPDVVRKVLDLSDTKLLVVGLAIGYPNWKHPLNQYRTARESLNGISRWYGFEDQDEIASPVS